MDPWTSQHQRIQEHNGEDYSMEEKMMTTLSFDMDRKRKRIEDQKEDKF